MKHLNLIYVFFLFSIVFLNACSGDDEPIDPALLIQNPTTCSEPSFFTVSAFINGNTVRIDWDKTTASAWEVQYGISGFAAGTGTTVNFTPTSSLISGLVSTTNYDFYIRTKCDNEEFSEWIGPVSPGSGIVVCVDPSNITAVRSTTDPTKATISWLANGDENSWQVQYGASGFVIGSGNILASATSIKVLSSLVPTTSYDVYVRSNCANNQNSDWIGPVIINPVGVITTCMAPTNLTAVRNATITSEATLTWAAGGTEAAWEIQYGATGFVPGSATSVTSTTTTKTITNLVVTAYDFYVRAQCSAGQNSAWVGPVNIAASNSAGSYYLRMKVDGTLLNFTVANTTTAYSDAVGFSIMSAVVNGADTKTISVQIANPSGVGTYDYNNPDFAAGCNYFENTTIFSSSYVDFTQSPGSIVITDLDAVNRTIKGTFTFIGKEDTMTQSRTITEGAFYLPYE